MMAARQAAHLYILPIKRLADQESNNKRKIRKTCADKKTECRSDKHISNCFAAMNQMRMNGILCDVRLVVEKIEIPANKKILASASPYFYAMFTNSNFDDAGQDKITIGGVDCEALQSLVEYVYTASIEITVDNVQSCLAAASLLQFPDVVEWCCEFLELQMDKSNCFGIRDTFDMYGSIDSVKRADQYIQRHFSEIIQQEQFLHVSHKRLVDLLKCDDLIVESEERVYESVLAWIRFDLNNREKYVADIMSNVRFPRMQKEYLSSHVETEPLIENNSCCKEYILEAYKLQLFETNRPTIDSTRIRHRCDRLKYMLIACGKTNAIELRDLNYSNLMFQKPCMPTKREHGGLVSLRGKVYAFGGFGFERYDTVDVYDPVADTWSPCCSMREKRATMGVAVLNDRIYVIGGYDESNQTLRSAEVYDPSADSWTYIEPTLEARKYCGAGGINGNIYVVGGGLNGSNIVERYNPEKNSWTRVANMNLERALPGVGVLDGILYVVGGVTSGDAFRSCEKYDTQTDTWSPIASMNTARRKPGVFAHNGYLYAVGSYDGHDSIEVYCPKMNKWEFLPWKINKPQLGASVCMIDSPFVTHRKYILIGGEFELLNNN